MAVRLPLQLWVPLVESCLTPCQHKITKLLFMCICILAVLTCTSSCDPWQRKCQANSWHLPARMAFSGKSCERKFNHRLCMWAYRSAFAVLLYTSRKHDEAPHQWHRGSEGSKSVKAAAEHAGVASGMKTGWIYNFLFKWTHLFPKCLLSGLWWVHIILHWRLFLIQFLSLSQSMFCKTACIRWIGGW